MTQWAAEMLVATTVLIALVLLLRRLVARYFGARAAFALWLAPLLRFLFPSFAQPIEAPQLWIDSGATAAATIAPVSAAVPLGAIVLIVWIGGGALFLAIHVIAYCRFVATALVGATELNEPGIGAGIDGVAILASDAVTGPAASGLLTQRIFVPRDFAAAFSPEERFLALSHEVLHHRRGDLWAGAAALACLALHWFNPLAHVAHRAFRRDLEAACDADLLARVGTSMRQTYARTILRCVARPVPHPICALTETDELKGRIIMLNHDHGRVARSFGKAIAVGITAVGLLFAIPAGAAPNAPALPESFVKIVRVDSSGTASATIPEYVQKCADRANSAVAGNTAVRANQPIRFLQCDKSGAKVALSAAALEKALGRIEDNQELPAAKKAQIVAALKAQIAAVNAGN
ncbi:MAG: M56 family metallopeptidase [Pseudomonadota bacterium]|nr:M56 family metallopeptidase [Pseudomonadota bacterium]